jgi:hypothetical protein
MDSQLLEGVLNATPEINSDVANGLATKQLLGAEQFVDEIFRCAAVDFPDGLTYEGYRRCTPQEEFNEATRSRDNRQVYELAQSDFYLVAYFFKYKKDENTEAEELFPRYLYLPYVQTGGLLNVRGKKFAIHPVLADPAFSVGSKSMFIQLTRARLTFERTTHHFMANDDRESTYVVWSWVHSTARNRQRRKSGSAKVIYSTMANYLFVRRGFTEAMREYAGADVVVGEDEITAKDYPSDEWVICSTVGNKPRAFMGNQYRSTRVRVAVPKEQYTQAAKSLIGAFFYIADHFPNRVKPEYVDDVWLWKVILGHIIYEPGTGEGLMVTEIEDHLVSLDEYLDSIVWKELKSSGVSCSDIYELFMYVIETLAQKTVSSDVGISSIYGKRLITLRYVLFDIVSQINTLMYKLRAAQKKRKKLEITEINNLMNIYLRSSRIATISNHAKHPEVNPVSTSNDNLFFGVTSTMLTQDSASTTGGKKSKINLKDPSKHLHASVAEVGSYNNIPKSDPTGRSRINPCVHVGPDGMVERDHQKKDLLDHVQKLLMQ